MVDATRKRILARWRALDEGIGLRIRAPFAVFVAGILGGLVFILLFPRADPCDLLANANHGCHSDFGSWHRHLWNAMFFIILAATGYVSGLIAPRRRYISGIASAIAASAIARFGVHAMYGLDYQDADWRLPATVVAAVIFVVIVGAFGALGALLSRSIRIKSIPRADAL
jgi:hypothetical protein